MFPLISYMVKCWERGQGFEQWGKLRGKSEKVLLKAAMLKPCNVLIMWRKSGVLIGWKCRLFSLGSKLCKRNGVFEKRYFWRSKITNVGYVRGAPLDAGTTLAQFVKCSGNGRVNALLNDERKLCTWINQKLENLPKLLLRFLSGFWKQLDFPVGEFSVRSSQSLRWNSTWKNHRNCGNLDEEKREYKQ